MLTPVLALIIWTLIVWVWMYATRVPAMQSAKIDPQKAELAGSLNELPAQVRVISDNYNHLHEAPTVFYALAFYTHFTGGADTLNIALAWGYVGLRVVHSFAQIIVRQVVVRFAVFVLSTLALMVIAIRGAAAALFGG